MKQLSIITIIFIGIAPAIPCYGKINKHSIDAKRLNKLAIEKACNRFAKIAQAAHLETAQETYLERASYWETTTKQLAFLCNRLNIAQSLPEKFDVFYQKSMTRFFENPTNAYKLRTMQYYQAMCRLYAPDSEYMQYIKQAVLCSLVNLEQFNKRTLRLQMLKAQSPMLFKDEIEDLDGSVLKEGSDPAILLDQFKKITLLSARLQSLHTKIFLSASHSAPATPTDTVHEEETPITRSTSAP